MKALLVDDDIVSRMALIDRPGACGVFELVEADDGAAARMRAAPDIAALA